MQEIKNNFKTNKINVSKLASFITLPLTSAIVSKEDLRSSDSRKSHDFETRTPKNNSNRNSGKILRSPTTNFDENKAVSKTAV